MKNIYYLYLNAERSALVLGDHIEYDRHGDGVARVFNRVVNEANPDQEAGQELVCEVQCVGWSHPDPNAFKGVHGEVALYARQIRDILTNMSEGRQEDGEDDLVERDEDGNAVSMKSVLRKKKKPASNEENDEEDAEIPLSFPQRYELVKHLTAKFEELDRKDAELLQYIREICLHVKLPVPEKASASKSIWTRTRS